MHSKILHRIGLQTFPANGQTLIASYVVPIFQYLQNLGRAYKHPGLEMGQEHFAKITKNVVHVRVHLRCLIVPTKSPAMKGELTKIVCLQRVFNIMVRSHELILPHKIKNMLSEEWHFGIGAIWIARPSIW